MRYRFPLLALGLVAVAGLTAAALRPPHIAPVARPHAPPALAEAHAAVATPTIAAAPARPSGHVARAASRRVTPPAVAPGQAGMVVAIDPETGQLGMPSPEQRAELLGSSDEQQLSRSMDGLVVEHHPNGAVSVDLQGRFQEYAMVRVGPDGKLVFT